jgi:hypothetical protein
MVHTWILFIKLVDVASDIRKPGASIGVKTLSFTPELRMLGQC